MCYAHARLREQHCVVSLITRARAKLPGRSYQGEANRQRNRRFRFACPCSTWNSARVGGLTYRHRVVRDAGAPNRALQKFPAIFKTFHCLQARVVKLRPQWHTSCMLKAKLKPYLEALRERRLTNRAVAKLLDVSEEHVSRVLKQLKLQKDPVPDPKKRKALLQTRAELRSTLANSMSITEAAKAANCSTRTIYRYRKCSKITA